MAGIPLPTNNSVQWFSNDALSQIEDEEITSGRPPLLELTGIAQHVRTFFESAKSAKLQVEQKMISSDRAIAGEYEPDKLQAILDAGFSDDFIRLTMQKCRDVEAWMLDVLNPSGDRTWDITPEGDPEIPPDVLDDISFNVRKSVLQRHMQEAQASGQPVDASLVLEEVKQHEDEIRKEVMQKAKEVAEERSNNMTQVILEQLERGGWPKAFKACIHDIAFKKTAVIKGPVYKRIKQLDWEEDPNTGKYSAVVQSKIIPTFDRVNPYDWYPAANSNDVEDGDAIELERFSRKDIQKLIGVPGYNDAAIREILNRYRNGYSETTPIDAERHYLEKDNQSGLFSADSNSKLDSLNYWGSVDGQTLLDYGMPKEEIPDPSLDYDVNVKMVGDIVYKAVLNPDPLGEKPYGVTSYIKSSDSQWGECPADLMEDLQGICNSTVRALVKNIGISSGPITEMCADRLAPGETPTIWPHKVIVSTNKMMLNTPAVRFYQSQLNARELIAVYEKFKREADDLVVPAFGHGSGDSSGAGGTSSGLSMLMTAAARNIKLGISNADQDLIIKTIKRLFNANMQFIDDDSIKGSLSVKTRGANAMLVKEQLSVRRREFLGTTLNPIDSQIMGVKGRAYMLAENVKALEMDPTKALPNMGEIEKQAPEEPLQSLAPDVVEQAAGQQSQQSQQSVGLNNAGTPNADFQTSQVPS